ncbi:MAG TPA: winged helix-turn-helix domain-containing protein [Nitrososphaeraceae archaeon]|nr:winged helix-turn-helix domain-containing protein [Nitrososphaeraceae archaeon]
MVVVVIMLKKRANLGIISLILEASSADAFETKKTTVIMYNTLLNHPVLKEYWMALTEEGLLVYDSATQTFKTTEKGLRFLQVFSELDRNQKNKNKNYPFSSL